MLTKWVCSLNTESYADKERRGFALSVLENPDQLMTFALSTGDVSCLHSAACSQTRTGHNSRVPD